jgi:ELWxxDGT repeat protein
MTVNKYLRNFWSALGVAFVLAKFSSGSEFAVLPVTHFGPQIGRTAIPVATLGDQLIFAASENGQFGIYSTDGSDVRLVDGNVTVALTPPTAVGFSWIEFENEIYFPGNGPDGTELYVTDGQAVRQVADIAQGSLSSSPRDFRLVNDGFVFEAADDSGNRQLFGTNGTMVKRLTIGINDTFTEPANVNNRLVFSGFPVGGGTLHAYSTDWSSLQRILTTDGQSLAGPDFFTEYAGSVYFVAGGLSTPGLYRTADGLVAERVAEFDDFTFTNVAEGMFTLRDSVYIQVENILTRETVFYKSEGGVPSAVLTWQQPDEILGPSAFEDQPLFVDEDRAYFSYRSAGFDTQLFAFDGSSFERVDLPTEAYREFEFVELGERTFVNARGAFESLALYELIDGEFVHLGPGLDSMALFEGELFGINNWLPGLFEAATLLRTENGRLVPMGDVGPRLTGTARPHFVEFNGQLYFSGTAGGQAQLYAIAAVPEPGALILTMILACGLVCSRRMRL